jgi:hypothetical protein
MSKTAFTKSVFILPVIGLLVFGIMLIGCGGLIPPGSNAIFPVTPVKHVFDQSVPKESLSTLVIQNGRIRIQTFNGTSVTNWFVATAKGTTVVDIPAGEHTITFQFFPGEGFSGGGTRDTRTLRFTATAGKKYLLWLEYYGMRVEVKLDEVGDDGRIIR